MDLDFSDGLFVALGFLALCAAMFVIGEIVMASSIKHECQTYGATELFVSKFECRLLPPQK